MAKGTTFFNFLGYVNASIMEILFFYQVHFNDSKEKTKIMEFKRNQTLASTGRNTKNC